MGRCFLYSHNHFNCNCIGLGSHPHRPMRHHNSSFVALGTRRTVRNTTSVLHRSGGIVNVNSPHTDIRDGFTLHRLINRRGFCANVTRNRRRHLRLTLGILHRNNVCAPTLHRVRSCSTMLILNRSIARANTHITLTIHRTIGNGTHRVTTTRGITS